LAFGPVLAVELSKFRHAAIADVGPAQFATRFAWFASILENSRVR
jgi:hypothetical protein